MNVLEVRLIGAQAIALARNCHRVMSAIYVDESEALKIKHQVLSLICCLLYTSPSPRDQRGSRMPSSA